MKKFDFKDINLVPKKGVVDSRSECDTTVKFGKYIFNSPVIPANMSSVINEELAIILAKAGYFYILHRFNVDSYAFVQKCNNLSLISSISIGVNDDSYLLIDKFVSNKIQPDYITIDIAHGHSIKMEKMLKYVKKYLPNVFVIAGNVCTQKATIELQNWGADAIKVGVAPGFSCTTNFMTGFGSRNCQASTIFECSNVSIVPIIADGGIQYPSDICKSIALGAEMIMTGALLSGCKDSPGNIVIKDGKNYKEYHGSASAFESNKKNRIEGTKKLVEMKENTMVEEMEFLIECLQSAISYAGGKNLSALANTKWI